MRKLCLLLAVAAAVLLLTGTVWADSTVVSSMDTTCTVETDGSCLVILRAQINFEPDTRDFVIPVSPLAREVAVSGAQYTLTRDGEFTQIHLQGSYSGKVDLTVSYRLAETVTDQDTTQAFSVTLLYPAWPCAIETYGFTIQLPHPFEELPEILSGYYGDLIDNYMEVSIQEGVIRADLNSKQVLQDHEAMSVSLTLPRDYFDLRFLAGKTVAMDRMLFFVFAIMSAVYWLVFLRNFPILPKRQTMPPVGGNAGEIPYVLTGDKPDLALMIVHWASLGYLTLHRTRKGRISLIRQIDMDNERKQFESQIFNALFARGDYCDLRSGEYAKARYLAEDKTKEYWQYRIYDRGRSTTILRLLAMAAGLALCLACFDASLAPKSWRWFAIVPLTLLGGAACRLIQNLGGLLLRRHSLRNGLLALAGIVYLAAAGKFGGEPKLAFLCILLQLTVGLLLRCGGPRTKMGSAQAAELLGFRRYLLSSPAQTLRSNLNTDPQYYYRCLPVADGLRVGKYFSAGFGPAKLENCDWLEWEGKPARTASAFYGRYSLLMTQLRGEREPFRVRRKRAALRAKRRRG